MAVRKRRSRKTREREPQPDLTEILSRSLREEMEDHWLNGWSEEKLAQRYGHSVEDIRRWIKKELVNKHRSRYERITMVFDNLFAATDVAHTEFMENPSNSNSMSYTGLVNSLRGAMVDLDNVQDNRELADELLKLALNPLIRKLTQVLIDELGNFKEELMLKFEEDDADRIANDVATRCGSHFKSALDDSVRRIENILGAQDKNKRKALKGISKKKKKKGHLKSVPAA